jgi:hypothetical protein
MGDVITDLLPLIVGATAVPFYPIVVLVLLQGQGGLIKALAFVACNIAVRLAQGVLFGIILGVALAASSEDGQRLGVSTLLLIVGILLLITAVKKWQKAEDPAAPVDDRHQRPLGGQCRWRGHALRDDRHQAVGLYPVRHRSHQRSWTGRGGEYRSIPVLCVGHPDACSDAYLGMRRGSAPGGQTAEGSAKLAGAAQSSDSNSCVTGFWGVVLIQGRQRIDRLTLAMSPAKREMT